MLLLLWVMCGGCRWRRLCWRPTCCCFLLLRLLLLCRADCRQLPPSPCALRLGASWWGTAGLT